MSETIRIACAACGHAAELPASDKQLPAALQCPMCGTWIQNLSDEVEAASKPTPEPDEPDAAERIVGHLAVAGATTTDQQYPLRGTKMVVGRESADVNTGDPTMSIHHFEIEKRGGELFIRDLDSTNHTKVNGKKITVTTLQPGDRIQAGLTLLIFLTD